MAYKFQVGDSIMSGALAQEGDVDLLDSGNLKIDATTVISSTRAVQNALTISGSSTLSGLDLVLAPGKTIGVAGDTDLITLNKDTGIAVAGLVSGTTGGFLTLTSKGLNAQAGGISNAGAVAGVTTLDASGLASLDGGIDVNGNLTVSTAGAVAGATTVSGSGVGSFGSLVLDGAANLQSAGITNAGSIAGATTIAASGKITGNEFATDGDEFSVSTAGAVTAVGVAVGGALSAATTMSGSSTISGLDMVIAPGKTIGVTGDTDLLTLDDGVFVVAGSSEATTLTATGAITGGSVSGSGNFDCGGKLEVNGGVEFHSIDPDTNYARATDGLYYYNADDGELKVTTNDAFLTAIAGAGLSVVGNQLEADAGSTTPNEFAPGDTVLIEGFNYATGSADSFTATLPAVAASNYGDMVRIKAGPLTAGKAITIQGHPSTPAHKIDGGNRVILESPYAAITCVYATSGSWYVL